jgi:hypothetical protein
MRWLPALLLVAACSEKKPPPAAKREVEGTLSLDGKPLTVTQCRAGRGVTTYVDLVTAEGKLRFEDAKLFWSRDATVAGRGDQLECKKLDRSWGGGLRRDQTSYFRGHLMFNCVGPAGPITGDVMVDCGNTTFEERQQLDENARKFREEQKLQRNAAGSAQ